MKSRFEQLASYNKWANARIYEAALALDESDYRRDVGAFFKSLHGTLNHLLVADRIWMKRLTGEGEHPDRLDAIIHEDRWQLAAARADEDDRIIRFVASLDDAVLAGTLKYATTSGKPFEQSRADVLSHFFNHQTHHRGQITTLLTQAGVDVGVTDLVWFADQVWLPER
jgi:uncharacterized damage-inducible protein DinB